MLGEITTKEQINELTHEQHLAYSELAIAHLHNVDWNGYNKAKRQSKASDYENFLKLAPAPAPYRSWPEFHMFNNTLLKHAEYEPVEHKVEYTISHKYQPDAVSSLNTRIFFEIKGCFRDIAEAMKYIHIAEQLGITFVFILQEEGIHLSWCKVRKDGSTRTIEEWCEVNGFYFCYTHTFDEFVQSDPYKRLVATA